MNSDVTLEVDGVKTLPLQMMFGRVTQDFSPLDEVFNAQPTFENPDYHPPHVVARTAGSDTEYAKHALQSWTQHFSQYIYRSQFRDDKDGRLTIALQKHSDFVAGFADAFFAFDAIAAKQATSAAIAFAITQQSYRRDSGREDRYTEYADKVRQQGGKAMSLMTTTNACIDRMIHALNTGGVLPEKAQDDYANPKLNENIPRSVFFSYAHQDGSYIYKLEKHLSVLKAEGLIDVWYDKKIKPGEEWPEIIDSRIRSADIVLLFLSSDFFASQNCQQEVNAALTRHKSGKTIAVPVVLRACEWQKTPLGDLQALPDRGKPVSSWENEDSAYLSIAAGLRGLTSG